jgi:hypothetical protein
MMYLWGKLFPERCLAGMMDSELQQLLKCERPDLTRFGAGNLNIYRKIALADNAFGEGFMSRIALIISDSKWLLLFQTFSFKLNLHQYSPYQ